MVIPDWCRGKRSSYDNAFVKEWYCCDKRSRETSEKRRNLIHEAQPMTSQQSWHWDDFSCRTFNSRRSCRCLSPNLPRPKDETHADYADGIGAPGQPKHSTCSSPLLNSRCLLWQKFLTRDKLYDLIPDVRKLKVNVACISEMKNFNPGGERVSFVFIEEYMFILAELTEILLDPMCRVAFQNGGSTLHVGSGRSLLIQLQFPAGSIAVGAVYFPTGLTAAMRDLFIKKW